MIHYWTIVHNKMASGSSNLVWIGRKLFSSAVFQTEFMCYTVSRKDTDTIEVSIICTPSIETIRTFCTYFWQF